MIYLCRHGETAFNRERRLQGWAESDLTSVGRKQAARMGELLRDLLSRGTDNGCGIISSPSRRARDTANIIAEKVGFPVNVDARLLEVSVGTWEGCLWSDVQRDHPELRGRSDWYFSNPGGETYEDVRSRAAEWMAAHTDNPTRRLIVVSHGVTGRLLRGIYAGLDKEQTLALDAPQDALYRLAGGQIDRLECETID